MEVGAPEYYLHLLRRQQPLLLHQWPENVLKLAQNYDEILVFKHLIQHESSSISTMRKQN